MSFFFFVFVFCFHEFTHSSYSGKFGEVYVMKVNSFIGIDYICGYIYNM